jgi:hypothetical protein
MLIIAGQFGPVNGPFATPARARTQ